MAVRGQIAPLASVCNRTAGRRECRYGVGPAPAIALRVRCEGEDQTSHGHIPHKMGVIHK